MDSNPWKISILASVEILFAFWISYISFNSYAIILQGLRRAYNIYLLHLMILALEAFTFLFRPLWKHSVNEFIFDSPTLCIIWGRLWGFIFFVPKFLATLFSYQKAKIYLQTHSSCLKYLPHLVWCGCLPLLALVIFYESGQVMISGNQSCATISRSFTKVLANLCFMHFIVMNFIMIYIFWRYAGLVRERVHELEHQLNINRRVVPLMAISSAIFLSIPIWGIQYVITNWSEWNYFVASMFHFIDNIFNNMIMHYTLFGHADFLRKEQLIQQRINDMTFDVSDDLVVQAGEIVSACGREKFWIDLPGLHPIQVTHEVVAQANIWDFVVTDKKTLKRIRKYKRRSQIPSLCQICLSSSDLLNYIESEERSNSQQRSQKPISVEYIVDLSE